MESIPPQSPSRSSGAERRGSARELAVVFGLTVGIPLLFTILGKRGLDFGQQRLLVTLIVELVLTALAWPWLRRRGWALGSIAGAPSPTDVLRGTGLALTAYIAYVVAATTWAASVPGAWEYLRDTHPTGAASAWVIIAVSVINPLFEEFLWLGYGYSALFRFGPTVAIWASIMLRVLVHAYQGPMAVVGILPLGLVFTYYFARSRRLWPVIVAHMIFDTIGLLQVLQS